ncbi:exonuclease SbcCD subunit D [Methanococcoides sp. SA1]|nr:exonuclease SbcCD subunit D [Methanococcoides sp. SA1]
MEQKRTRFAHLADCHLGGWSQPELQELNFQSFQKAVQTIQQENLDFVLISGDLFDSSYPSIDILKKAFTEFKRLYEARIPVYIIPGSHDFSASGKTFLDVIEKAGFCKNVHNFEVQEDESILLKPTFHNEIAIYGYPGKKSGMEVKDIKRIKIEEINPFTILMLHTTIDEVKASLQMESLDKGKLPLANYYAMGHIHQRHESQIFDSKYIYPGPTFPNNFQELSDLKHGSFQIIEIDGQSTKSQSIELPLKEVASIEIQLDNGITATEKIIEELDKRSLAGKIVLLKLTGILTQGKTGDIRFNEIADFVKKKDAYSYIRNISSIKIMEDEVVDMQNEKNEKEIIQREFDQTNKINPNDLNEYLQPLMEVLSLERNEDEKSANYEERLISEIKETLGGFEL